MENRPNKCPNLLFFFVGFGCLFFVFLMGLVLAFCYSEGVGARLLFFCGVWCLPSVILVGFGARLLLFLWVVVLAFCYLSGFWCSPSVILWVLVRAFCYFSGFVAPFFFI